jgi:recombination protein RecR
VNTLEVLIKHLSKMPGIGRKSAARIAYFLLKQDQNYLSSLGSSISSLRDKIIACSECGSYTEKDPCPICADPGRDHSTICVVEQSQDVYVIESTREYNGVYHVLGGIISPIDGIGPKELSIGKLLHRGSRDDVGEIILALNPTVEGDTTALYIVKMLKDKEVKITKLASGLPVGGDLEYAGSLTLSRSLLGRTELHLRE